MPSKGSFWSDTFEQLAELGTSTVKQTGQAVKQTVNPSKIIGQIIGSDQAKTSEGGQTDSVEERSGKTESVKKSNSTPLNFQKLQENYHNQDKQKQEALRSRLFQLVKSGEEKIVQEKEKEVEEKKRKETYEEQEKKRKQQQAQQQQGTIPQGKVRRSVLGRKKAAQQQQAEIKPSTGKQ